MTLFDRGGSFTPGKRWSLRDLINFQAGPLVSLVGYLAEEEAAMKDKDLMAQVIGVMKAQSPSEPIPIPEARYKVVAADIERIKGILGLGEHLIKSLFLERSEDRLARFFVLLSNNGPFRTAPLLAEIRALRDAIEDDCKYERFFHYSRDAGRLLLTIPGDWARTFHPDAFPSVQGDVSSATDCFAIGHYTACIFHLMRVAEIGLRSIARERKVRLKKDKPLEWADWGTIIGAIEAARDDIQHQKPAGPGKDAALEFYSGSLAHLAAFKDQYRNQCSHVRKDYEKWEATIALNHVRDFMNGLSPKVGEKTTRSIRWKF